MDMDPIMDMDLIMDMNPIMDMDLTTDLVSIMDLDPITDIVLIMDLSSTMDPTGDTATDFGMGMDTLLIIISNITLTMNSKNNMI
jgi:hypothetical protein